MNNNRVDKTIRNFQDFLINAWPAIKLIRKFDDPNLENFEEDWLQSNWEILAEGILCEPGREYLEVYGAGADCNGDSSRVFLPKATATHRICCSPLNQKSSFDLISKREIDIPSLPFDQFVSWDGKWFDTSPPFDHVLLENPDAQKNPEIVINSSEIIFEAEKL